MLKVKCPMFFKVIEGFLLYYFIILFIIYFLLYLFIYIFYIYIYIYKLYIFYYLTMLGLSCGMWDHQSSMQQAGSLLVASGL